MKLKNTLNYLFFLIMILCSAFSCAADNTAQLMKDAIKKIDKVKIELKIIGGDLVKEGEIEYQAALLYREKGQNPPVLDQFFCGGFFISKKYLLTAAHCAVLIEDYAEFFDFRVGVGSVDLNSNKLKVHEIKKVKVHNKHYDTFIDYDLALIKIDGNYSGKVISVVSSDDASQINPGLISTVSGWGVDESGVVQQFLRKVAVPVVSRKDCIAAYPNDITDRMFCAGLKEGGKDSCAGDSGGPLVVKIGSSLKALGIVSWGEGCALPEKYGVYTRLLVLTDWIKNNSK